MSTIDLNALLALSVGDIVETPSPLGGLCTEAALFQVEATDGTSVTFRVMCHGIYMTKAVLKKTKKGIVWM